MEIKYSLAERKRTSPTPARYGWKVLWPVGQAIFLAVYLWALLSQSEGFGSIFILAFVFPICILLIGILPFFWLFLGPRWIPFKRAFFCISILSFITLVVFASKDLVLAVAGPYLKAHLQAIVDSNEYEVTTELYYEQGKPLGYVVNIKSKITSPNSIYEIDFDPKISLAPLKSESVKNRYDIAEINHFRPTSFSQRKSACEDVSDGRVCRFIFLPDLVQSEKNMVDPRSVEDLCTLSHPVTVLISEVSCPYFVAPFVYSENKEKVYASIVPPSGYDGTDWAVVTTEDEGASWVYNYDLDFYQPERWDALFSEERETLYVLIRKNAYVRGFREGMRTITNSFGPVDVSPVKIFNKDILENAAWLPACKISGVIRGPSSSAFVALERCRPHFEKYMEMDASLKQTKPVIIDRTGTVYFSDAQKDVSSSVDQSDTLSMGTALAEQDLLGASKDMDDYTAFKQYVDSTSALFFSDFDSSEGGAGIRLSDYGGLKNGTKSVLYAKGQVIEPLNRNVVGSIKSVAFQSPAHARKFMEMLYREKGLKPNGNFPNEFTSKQGRLIYWIHRNTLFYMNVWRSPEDFRKQAMTYFTAVFPPDFSPVP